MSIIITLQIPPIHLSDIEGHHLFIFVKHVIIIVLFRRRLSTCLPLQINLQTTINNEVKYKVDDQESWKHQLD